MKRHFVCTVLSLSSILSALPMCAQEGHYLFCVRQNDGTAYHALVTTTAGSVDFDPSVTKAFERYLVSQGKLPASSELESTCKTTDPYGRVFQSQDEAQTAMQKNMKRFAHPLLMSWQYNPIDGADKVTIPKEPATKALTKVPRAIPPSPTQVTTEVAQKQVEPKKEYGCGGCVIGVKGCRKPRPGATCMAKYPDYTH